MFPCFQVPTQLYKKKTFIGIRICFFPLRPGTQNKKINTEQWKERLMSKKRSRPFRAMHNMQTEPFTSKKLTDVFTCLTELIKAAWIFSNFVNQLLLNLYYWIIRLISQGDLCALNCIFCSVHNNYRRDENKSVLLFFF